MQQTALKIELKEKDWPQLYALASTGKIKTWKIWVTETLTSDNIATIWTRHGYLDGKLQDKPKHIKVGKNIGKANETTPFEQACSQAQSTYNKKVDKKYITEIPTEDNIPDFVLPMLAKSFKDCKHRVNWPALAQPKLNGVRCFAKKISETEIDFTSRKGKSYNKTLGHLKDALLEIMKVDEIFDGEIYVHGWTFQQILRRVKKVRSDTHKLQFWVYDIADDQMPSINRNQRYFDAIPENHDKIIRVPSEMVVDEADFYRFHNSMVAQGFEGAIIRNVNAPYKFDFRSMDLQKYKHFEDKEFDIVGFKAEDVQVKQEDGTFIEKQAIIFICANEQGDTFDPRPRGSIEQRIKWFKDGDNLIGKELTVRFQERSEDNIPIFPVGLAIRDYE